MGLEMKMTINSAGDIVAGPGGVDTRRHNSGEGNARAYDLTPAIVNRLAAYLLKSSGLQINLSKTYLIESKLKALIKRRGLSGFAELVQALEDGTEPDLSSDVVQSMTINETHFFRDQVPFQALLTILPELLHEKRFSRSLRIWSAACSTGQEIYSIAMMLDEMSEKLGGYKVDLVATDISAAVLDKAASGSFARFEVERGLPPRFAEKYFKPCGSHWIIDDRIRRQVKFQRQNLLEDFSALGRFDFVFCRNVLIYFNSETRCSILERIGRQLSPEGLLVLGSAESMVGLASGYVLDQRSPVYMRLAGSPETHERKLAV